MRKLLFLVLLVPSISWADRLGSLNANSQVLLSTQGVTASSTAFVQNSLTPTTTTQVFSVQIASVSQTLIVQSTANASNFVVFKDSTGAQVAYWRGDGRLLYFDPNVGGKRFAIGTGSPLSVPVAQGINFGSDNTHTTSSINGFIFGLGNSLTGSASGTLTGSSNSGSGGSVQVYGNGNSFSGTPSNSGQFGYGTSIAGGDSNFAIGNGVAIPSGINRVVGFGTNYAPTRSGTIGYSTPDYDPIFNLQRFSSTNAVRDLFDLKVSWSNSTDATRKARAQFYIYDTSAREFMRADTDGTSPFTTFTGSVTFVSTSAIQNTLTPTTTTQQFSVKFASASYSVVTSSMNVERKVTAYSQDALRVDIKDSGSGFGEGYFQFQSADPVPILKFTNSNFEARDSGAGARWRVQPAQRRMFLIPGGSVPNTDWIGFMSSDETTTFSRWQTADTSAGGALFDVPSNAAANVMNVLGQASQTGVLLKLKGTSSTNAIRDQVDLDATFSDSTDATRKARFIGRVYDFNGAKEFMRSESDGDRVLTSIGGQAVISSAALSITLSSNTSVGMIIRSTTNQSGNMVQFQDFDGTVFSLVDGGGVASRRNLTIAKIRTYVPAVTGQSVYCTDCTTTWTCISTGTAAGDFAAEQATNKSKACN